MIETDRTSTRQASFRWVSILFALCIGATASKATTYVNRFPFGNGFLILPATLSTRTWTAAGSPYICEDNVTVDSGATLTVQSGVQVEFNQDKGLYVNGTLSADGVSFTQRNAGQYWLGIYLSPAAGSSSIKNSVVSGAGSVTGLGTYHGNQSLAAIYVDACDPLINSNSVTDSQMDGLELYSSSATVQGNVFTNMGLFAAAMRYDTTDCFPFISGNSVTGAWVPGITLAAGSITTNGIYWNPGTDFPYFLTGNVTIVVGKTVSVAPGAVFEASNCGFNVLGTLSANGTSSLPVTFTSSINGSPAAGDWYGFTFRSTAGASNLDYCVVQYAGKANVDADAAIYVDGCNPKITNSTIADSSTNGIQLHSSAATVQNNTIQNVGASSYAIRCDDTGSFPVMGGNVAGGTGDPVCALATGALSLSGEWYSPGAAFPLLMRGNNTVNAGVTLTVGAGAEVKVASSAALTVEGTLKALGGLFVPTSFTSAAGRPTSGDWRGIYFGPNAGASTISLCTINYAGMPSSYAGHPVAAAIFADQSSPSIILSTVNRSANAGIELLQSDAAIHNVEFDNMGTDNYDVAIDSFTTISGTYADSFPNVANNSGSGTGIYGIGVSAGATARAGHWYAGGSNFPYYLRGKFTALTPNMFTIDPGVTVKALPGAGFYALGNLTGLGTSDARITFTSAQPVPQPGDWLGVYLNIYGLSKISFWDITYAGATAGLGTYYGSNVAAALALDSSGNDLINIRVAHSQHDGIDCLQNQDNLLTVLVYDNGGPGVRCVQSDPHLYNATIAHNAGSGVLIGTNSLPFFTNCIVAFNGLNGYYGVGTALADIATSDTWGNPFGDYAGSITTPLPGLTSDIEVDPGFVAAGADDFHLSAGSPCRDIGFDIGTAQDLDGNPRKQGPHVDFGAFEATPNSAWTVANVAKALHIAGGLLIATSDDMARLNLETGGSSAGQIDLNDAVRILRKVTGTEPNP